MLAGCCVIAANFAGDAQLVLLLICSWVVTDGVFNAYQVFAHIDSQHCTYRGIAEAELQHIMIHCSDGI